MAKVAKEELRSYIMSKVSENDFTMGEFDTLKSLLDNIDLAKEFDRYGGSWQGFEEYVDNLIDEVLYGKPNDEDENFLLDNIKDFEKFDSRYNEEGFMQHNENDELPDDFDNGDLFDSDYDEEMNHNERVDTEEQKAARQASYERESERNRNERLECKTPEELFNFKKKMGWIPKMIGATPQQKAEMIQREFQRCKQEIEMREKVQESFDQPYWLQPFIAKPNNKNNKR